MKTLRDYVKGFGRVPILMVAEHRSKDGTKYYLTKQEGYNSFYFMKGEEVVKKEYIPNDKYPELAIAHLNHKKDPQIIKEICEQVSYIKFVKFIFDECGEEFKL